MDDRISQEFIDLMDGCVNEDGAINFGKMIAKIRLVITKPESIRKLDELEREILSETDSMEVGASV